MRSAVGDGCCEHPPGFPIRTPPDQRSFASSPELFAGCRVLRRLSMPRHPPYTLNRLTTFIDHRLTSPPNTTGRRGCGERPRVSPKRCPTTPALRKDTSSPPGGDHREGSAGAGVADSPGAPPCTHAHRDHRTTYYLEPRHSLVKEQSIFCGASFGGWRNSRQTSRRTRVRQPCLVGGLIRVRQSMLLIFCVSRVTG
jgi:hypothetical protein